MKRDATEPIEELEKRTKQDNVDEPLAVKQVIVNAENRLPSKVRIAMIVGYNGSDFCGSQKNKNVRTVEEQIEDALLDMNVINKLNYGDLKKIGWSRATRTDKSVHAL